MDGLMDGRVDRQTDILQHLTILLFTPANAVDFSTQICGTLSNAFWLINPGYT